MFQSFYSKLVFGQYWDCSFSVYFYTLNLQCAMALEFVDLKTEIHVNLVAILASEDLVSRL